MKIELCQSETQYIDTGIPPQIFQIIQADNEEDVEKGVMPCPYCSGEADVYSNRVNKRIYVLIRCRRCEALLFSESALDTHKEARKSVVDIWRRYGDGA